VISYEQWLTECREDEMRYRKRGYFERADRIRCFADLVEAGEDHPQPCCYFDRGTCMPIEGHLEDGMAVIHMSGGSALALTPDLGEQLAGALLHWLRTDAPDRYYGLILEGMRASSDDLLREPK